MLKSRFLSDTKVEVGIDEVGRGCLWGPLVTGAVVWPPENTWTDDMRKISAEIKDSKKLTEKKRTALSDSIWKYAIDVGIGVVEPQEIDSMGMTASNTTGFLRAVMKLQKIVPERLLLDGTLLLPDWEGEQHSIIDGDAEYLSIAAASIVAKVYRDTWVGEWCKEHEAVAKQYSLESSKGYGTAAHRAAVKTYGMLQGHRRLFLRKILGEEVYIRPIHTQTQTQIQTQSNDTPCLIQDT